MNKYCNLAPQQKSERQRRHEEFLSRAEEFLRKTDGRAQIGVSQYVIVDTNKWDIVKK